ncbi:MAG: hypothetical protein WCD76_04970 [Pyrinomonadaceae bacterium]
MRILLCLFVLLLPPHAARRQDGRRFLDVKLIPSAGKTLKDFVPRGWVIEEQANGDLNGDGAADAALRLIEDLPQAAADGAWNERFRALVVLLKKPDGTFERAGVATRLLYCSTCAGMLSDPDGGNLSVAIKNGILNVYQLSGAREATDLTQRFRYDTRLKRFVLIGEDREVYDRPDGDGTTVSTNYLTGVRKSKTTKLFKEGQEPRVVSNKTARIPVSRRFIEDIDYEH